MLKVSVVEVARSVVKQLGINVGGNWNVLDAAGAVTQPGHPASSASARASSARPERRPAGVNIQGQATLGNDSTIGGTLTALERAGVSRVLAEPTLVAISGETATFLVGGEIPIVHRLRHRPLCVPTVTYKQYGVALAFTPIVLSEGRISLRVSTEVSEIDRENAGRRRQRPASGPARPPRRSSCRPAAPWCRPA